MIPEKLSVTERQILANQFRILAKLEENESLNVKADILTFGYTGKYHEVFNVHSDEVPIEVCKETGQILNMYRRINNTIATLTSEQKESVDLDRIAFKGFDANNDSHYHYASFMIDEMNLWQEHKGKNINSHTYSTLVKYKKMLEYHNNKISQKENWDIDFEDIKKMIDLV